MWVKCQANVIFQASEKYAFLLYQLFTKLRILIDTNWRTYEQL